jgi:ribosomal-protein-alanine N-acetyltransferase
MGRILTDIRFRLATPADATEIAEMSRRLIETGLGWSWTRQRVEHAIRNAEALVLTAVYGSEIIGFGIMEFGDETAHLSLFAVREPFQRKGIGLRMFEWLRSSALTAGIALIRLELRVANFDAQAFYRKLGFIETGRAIGYYRGRENALRMALDLRNPSKE